MAGDIRPTTLVQIAAPVCLEAIRRYAAELARRTPLLAEVTAAEPDVDFSEGAQARAVRVVWNRAARADAGTRCPEWEDEEGDGPPAGENRDRLAAHYAATVEALARNAKAARALLGILKRA